ncbi:DUF692 domain-containing protein [Litorivivens sp.]|uniref:HvfB family MNIO-type RiPP peptide maturase n=1 Tax=Litorivivens sp. TaxID=2020868 RepID=UPI003563AD98
MADVKAGLGLRRAISGALKAIAPGDVDFMEVAPENWMHLGGRLRKDFDYFADRYPIYLHGLSLNIGGVAPLDRELLLSIREFMRDYQCPLYTEHLTYCADEGQLYDLMPIPFTEAAVRHVSDRVKEVQDVLGQQIALENASYYAAPGQEMSESDFIRAVLESADCKLLLDVNNIYVNSINHRYDPLVFMDALPLERACYLHIAGHYEEAEDLRVDTHGADVIEPVWALLDAAYDRLGVLPTLVERDFNFPPMAELLGEVARVRAAQRRVQAPVEATP